MIGLPINSLATWNTNANTRIRGEEQPNLHTVYDHDIKYSKPTWLELSVTVDLKHLPRHLNHRSEVLRMKWIWFVMKTSLSNRSIQSWARQRQSSGRATTFWKMEPLPVSRILLLSQDEVWRPVNNICAMKYPCQVIAYGFVNHDVADTLNQWF